MSEDLKDIRTYRITIKKDGARQVFTAWGKTLNEAENSVQAYVGNSITFISGKDITNDLE